MGGLFFTVYSSKCVDRPTDLEITRAFTKLKHRGDSFSHLESLQSKGIGSQRNIDMYMTKAARREHVQYNFILGHHRSNVSDGDYNMCQPFRDPIPSKILEFPELNKRPRRFLVCNGEVYNYPELVSQNSFGSKDLCSNSDVEVILPMYIKHGLEKTLEDIDGEFAFCILDNIDTLYIDKIDAYVARDIIGTRQIHVMYNNDRTFFMFVSDPVCLPNRDGFTTLQIPIGAYWSFQNTFVNKNKDLFIKYYDISKFHDNYTITSMSPEVIENMYITIKDLITTSVVKTLSRTSSVGILLSDGFSSALLKGIVLEHAPTLDVHCFSYGHVSCQDNQIIHHLISDSVCLSTVEINRVKVCLGKSEVGDSDVILYCLFKYIKEHSHIRVVLCGEGLNEMFSESSCDALERISEVQLKTIDTLAGMFDIEVRYPFLSERVIRYIMGIHPDIRKPQYYKSDSLIDKYIIRKSFEHTKYIDTTTLWKPACKSSLLGTFSCF